MYFDRTAAGQGLAAKRPAKTRRLQPPLRGLVQNESLADPKPGGAEIMRNFFPTAQGMRLRRGSQLHATVDESLAEDVTHLPQYEYGGTEKLFATTASKVFDITTPADPETAPTPSVINMTSGYWSSAQFSNAGTHTLVMVNGADLMLQYDGTYWVSCSTAAVSRLNYDAETSPFTEAATLTGGTSGATATIQRVIDNGTTGTLLLTGISGTFQDNETITDNNGTPGSATANGTVSTVKAAVTGVTTSTLTQVWSHKSRLWFVEADSLSAWYFGVGNVTGALTEFPLNGVFKKGGELLFGATWSLDAGDGLDDVCLFVTTEGEVAVYSGTDPSSSTTWTLVGVYKIGRPMGKNSFFRAGGDLAIVTDDGIVPVSAAIKEDRSALRNKAITYPIEDLWRNTVRNYDTTPRAFEATLWSKESALFVTMPDIESEDEYCLAANARTGAWCEYTWDARCFGILRDRIFFGTSTGTVFEGEITGADNGKTYTCRAAIKFDMMGSTATKATLHARVLARTNVNFIPQLYARADFDTNAPSPPASAADVADNVWGTAVWDAGIWSIDTTSQQAVTSEWQSVGAVGTYISLGIQVTSGSVVAPRTDIVSFQIVYEEGSDL